MIDSQASITLDSMWAQMLSSWPDIEFFDDRDGCLFIATVHRKPVNVGVNVGVNGLFAYIQNNPGQRAGDMANAFAVTRRTIERWLKHLKDSQQIEYRGAPKTGGYYCTQVNN